MSVVEVGVYLVWLSLEYWDWYLLIGVMLSVAFTSWDLKRFNNGDAWMLAFFDWFGNIWIGNALLFIFNAVLWPLEIVWRLYRDFLYSCSK